MWGIDPGKSSLTHVWIDQQGFSDPELRLLLTWLIMDVMVLGFWDYLCFAHLLSHEDCVVELSFHAVRSPKFDHMAVDAQIRPREKGKGDEELDVVNRMSNFYV